MDLTRADDPSILEAENEDSGGFRGVFGVLRGSFGALQANQVPMQTPPEHAKAWKLAQPDHQKNSQNANTEKVVEVVRQTCSPSWQGNITSDFPRPKSHPRILVEAVLVLNHSTTKARRSLIICIQMIRPGLLDLNFKLLSFALSSPTP